MIMMISYDPQLETDYWFYFRWTSPFQNTIFTKSNFRTLFLISQEYDDDDENLDLL